MSNPTISNGEGFFPWIIRFYRLLWPTGIRSGTRRRPRQDVLSTWTRRILKPGPESHSDQGIATKLSIRTTITSIVMQSFMRQRTWLIVWQLITASFLTQPGSIIWIPGLTGMIRMVPPVSGAWNFWKVLACNCLIIWNWWQVLIFITWRIRCRPGTRKEAGLPCSINCSRAWPANSISSIPESVWRRQIFTRSRTSEEAWIWSTPKKFPPDIWTWLTGTTGRNIQQREPQACCR